MAMRAGFDFSGGVVIVTGGANGIGAALARYFTPPYPASTMIEVSRLVSPDQLVEIEAVAALAPRRPPDSPAHDYRQAT